MRGSRRSPRRRAGRQHVAPGRSGALAALDPGRPRGSQRREGVRRCDGGSAGLRRGPQEGTVPWSRRAGALRCARDRIARSGIAGRQSPRNPCRHRRQRGRCLRRRQPCRRDVRGGDPRRPDNEDAKYNLELVLRRIKVVGSREGAGGSSGDFGDSLTGRAPAFRGRGTDGRLGLASRSLWPARLSAGARAAGRRRPRVQAAAARSRALGLEPVPGRRALRAAALPAVACLMLGVAVAEPAITTTTERSAALRPRWSSSPMSRGR